MKHQKQKNRIPVHILYYMNAYDEVYYMLEIMA